MTAWYVARSTSWSTRAVIAAVALAALLVAVVPVAFFAGLILMLLGHVVGGLALFGASVLAAGAAVAGAAMGGVRYLRKMVAQQREHIVQLRRGDYSVD
jgi:uncharacterized membrane protein